MKILPFPKVLVHLLMDYSVSFDAKFIGFLKSWSSKSLNLKLKSAHGLVSDGEYIYVTDQDNGCVKTLCKDGEILYKSYHEINTEYFYPNHIIIHESKLYVTDWELAKVHILSTPDLKPIKYYHFQDICWNIFIHKSEMYIVHDNKIGIYTMQAVYKRHINFEDIGPDHLILKLYGLYIDNDIIYTCCFESGKIITCTIEGTNVMIFDLDDNDGTRLHGPHTIVVNDQYIYIGDLMCIRQCTKTGQTIKKWRIGQYENSGFIFLDKKCYVVCNMDYFAVFK